MAEQSKVDTWKLAYKLYLQAYAISRSGGTWGGINNLATASEAFAAVAMGINDGTCKRDPLNWPQFQQNVANWAKLEE